MSGGNARYDSVSSFQSQIFELRLQVWGEPRTVDRRIIRGNPNVDSPDFVEIGIDAAGRVAQVVAVGHDGDADLLEALVRTRFQIDGNEELLKDPGHSLLSILQT